MLLRGHRPHVRSALRIAAVLGVLAASLTAAGAAAPAPEVPPAPVESATQPAGADDLRFLGLSPARFAPIDAARASQHRYRLQARNTTLETLRIQPIAIPLEGSSRPGAYAQPAGSGSRNARAVEWVTFPGFSEPRELRPGRQLVFPAVVTIPASASPGTYAIGLAVRQRVTAPATSIGSSTRVDLANLVVSPAVLRVPGDAVAAASVRDIQAPRVVWGGRRQEFRARVVNVGDTDLVLDGKVDLDAFLGSAGRTLDAAGAEQGQATLPDGQRDLVMRWGDPPLLGWFSPELVVVGGAGSGVRITRQLPTVYVLPPWWLIALLVAALLLPLWARRRRRRRPGWQEMDRTRRATRVEERLRKQEAIARARQARGRR